MKICPDNGGFWRNSVAIRLLPLAFLVLVAGSVRSGDAVRAAPAAKTIHPTNFSVNRELFTSSLPVLVFEIKDSDADFNLTARMILYDKPGGGNTLDDAPAAVGDVLLRERRDDRERGKISYALELAAGTATPEGPLALAGLPPDRQWLLRGSSRDKTMLRNGVAYMLGHTLMPDVTPETRFCEVIFSFNGIHQYEGVYILAETEERIFREHAAPGDAGILLRTVAGRARREEDVVRVGNKFFAPTRLWSTAPFTRDDRRELGVELEKLESVLHSVNPGAFLRYQSYLDESSAVGFQLLNSLMLNLFGDAVPFSLLKNREGKFQFLPDWDFDNAIDNDPVRTRLLPFDRKKIDIETPSILSRRPPVWRVLEEGGDIRDLRMYPVYRSLDGEKFMWLDRLFLSRSYLARLYAEFHRCRNLHFSPQNLLGVMDAVALQLGPAIERDWIRWGKEYGAAPGPNRLEPFVDARGVSHNRQTVSFDQELVKIAHCLKKQDDFLGRQIGELYWMSSDLFDKGKSGNRQAGYSLATLVGMMLIIFILTRRL